MAFHRLLRPAAVGICLLLTATVSAEEKKPTAELMLFDGESTFGLEVTGDVAVKDGKLVIGGEKGGSVKTVGAFPGRFGFVLADYRYAGKQPFVLRWMSSDTAIAGDGSSDPTTISLGTRDAGHGAIALKVPAGCTLTLSRWAFRPDKLEPLFNGKDLTGWKRFTGDAKREKSKFEVTAAGELSLKDGPGDLQTEQSFADFLLQLECKTNGKGLNSGVFFRCLPGQYQQGYEAQVQNLYVGDRTKPADFGTGAIYRRIAARKVVSDDGEWFTLSVLATGPTICTWVNGYPTVSWTDDRKSAENARQGLYTKPGPLSLQGHDPTTDLLFRNIRISK